MADIAMTITATNTWQIVGTAATVSGTKEVSNGGSMFIKAMASVSAPTGEIGRRVEPGDSLPMNVAVGDYVWVWGYMNTPVVVG